VEQLLLYWDDYKDLRLSKWLKFVSSTFDAQKEHYSIGNNILSKEEWKKMSSLEPEAFKEPSVFSLQPLPPLLKVLSFILLLFYVYFRVQIHHPKQQQLQLQILQILLQSGRSSKHRKEKNFGSMKRHRRVNGRNPFDGIKASVTKE
jgi:hypothetical protein